MATSTANTTPVTTTKPAVTSTPVTATVPVTAKPLTTKPAPVKADAPKPAVKKAASSKAATKKSPVVKATPVSQPVVKKAAVKRPLSSAFAPAKAEKTIKGKKPKLVRDSFTIPKAEYVVLEELKQRAARLTRPAKKSELLRAGIKALLALSDAAFLTALEQVPTIKTGRPALKN